MWKNHWRSPRSGRGRNTNGIGSPSKMLPLLSYTRSSTRLLSAGAQPRARLVQGLVGDSQYTKQAIRVHRPCRSPGHKPYAHGMFVWSSAVPWESPARICGKSAPARVPQAKDQWVSPTVLLLPLLDFSADFSAGPRAPFSALGWAGPKQARQLSQMRSPSALLLSLDVPFCPSRLLHSKSWWWVNRPAPRDQSSKESRWVQRTPGPPMHA